MRAGRWDVPITNPDKPFFPEAALTKGDILVDIEFVLPTKDACRLDRLPE